MLSSSVVVCDKMIFYIKCLGSSLWQYSYTHSSNPLPLYIVEYICYSDMFCYIQICYHIGSLSAIISKFSPTLLVTELVMSFYFSRTLLSSPTSDMICLQVNMNIRSIIIKYVYNNNNRNLFSSIKDRKCRTIAVLDQAKTILNLQCYSIKR